MAQSQDHSKILDQLQAELDRVLEQTGRLFAAAKGGSKAAPATQASKLKRELPGVIGRFQEALDQLEDELELAKRVIRRDLAECRGKQGVQIVNDTSGHVAAENLGNVESSAARPQNQDVEIPEPSAPADLDLDRLQTAGVVAHNSPGQQPASDSPPQDLAIEQQSVAVQPPAAQAVDDNSKPISPAMELDIETSLEMIQVPTEDQSGDDQAMDETTFSNNADVDSLFNDPASASAGEAPEFTVDTDAPTSFDFETFTANLDNDAQDNDNISALLPGLQDYANPKPSGNVDPDYSALFAVDGEPQQSAAEQHDSTFDDLMEFTDFDADGYGPGTEGNTQDFEFSFD